MKGMRSRLLATTFMLGAFVTSAPAFAQSAPAGTGNTDASTTDATAQQSTGDVVVTGSRIARPDLDGTSPVTVVSSQDIALRAASTNIENVLNDLPQVTATTSSTSNNPGGGVATVNLRGLGAQRTLVLVDGRRYMSYDVNQIVDLNTVPAPLISRVDVLTGGSSAVYGSDAIAGVVNFVLKRDYSGVEAGSSYNVTEKGDGQIWDVYGLVGANFDDNRGNVTMFVDYTQRKPTFAGEREFSRNALSDNQDGSPLFAAGGSPSVPQGRIRVPGLNAALNNGCGGNAAAYQVFNPNGSSKCYAGTDGYNFSPINYLQVPQERFLVSAMGQYEINDHFVPYFEAQFANNRVNNQLAPTPISQGTPFGSGVTGPLTLQVNSPFLATSVQNALRTLDTDGNGYVTVPQWNYRTVGLGPRVNEDERNAFRVVAGMKGDIGAGFSYDGYYMYARTKNSQRQTGNIAIDRFLQATNTAYLAPGGAVSAFPVAGGTLVCADATARAAGCAPANIFGLGNLSTAAANYIGIGATNLETYTTEVANFTITNPSIVDFGAGGVGVAVGTEWRREAGQITPDQFLASGNVAGFNPGQATGGSYSVREFFGEIRVPLLSDTFIHRLELNGAARATHYSNAPGNVFTWAGGAEFAPIQDITFRGQYQRAIRGPSVNELFLGNTVSFNGNSDQCGTAAATAAGSQLNAICRAQFAAAGAPVALIGNATIQDPNNVNPLTFTGGNPNLREESANTYTLGTVIRPRFLPRFALTVDYYNINIKGYIAPVPTQQIGDLCFKSFNQAACAEITRNSAGQIETFGSVTTPGLSYNTNSGGLKTSGLDISAGYSQPIGALLGADNANLRFSFSGSRLFVNDYTPVSALPDTVIRCAGRFGANCGVPTPKWRHTARTTLDLGQVSASLQWRYMGPVTDDNPQVTYATERLPARNYFDLTTSFLPTENLTLNLGVTNLFNTLPPLTASTQNGGNGQQSNTFPTFYDVLGRSFFVSAKMKF
ncbi:TonB-dependent receptor domain-containing protein [Sphingomonas paucimobilis]|uniref:TonB-dependent receptor domain-containing protein n=1 Tax=Sphingomonas paucimobilis TaxID=13689 RepID=UPI0028D7A515|nr:TonB-dependent receptor [Sphingomonas paucimobilis]